MNGIGSLSRSIRAPTAKYHRLGGLQTTEIPFSRFWKLESETRVPACPSAGKSPLVGYRLPTSHYMIFRRRAQRGSELSRDF